ncbi:MAG TPA: alkaline phosphatase family protein [Bryobacteraceae bacterium]|nr:alkaline phosphatase family protein [Bryobacteraceae bacterium]
MSKVLLIGWDAADWKVIRPLIDAGEMPNIARLVRTGASASIATLQPSFSPMLWTSIATGKRPFDHGIHGFSEPRPDGRDIQRISNLSRKCKAVWNILGQSGLRSIVVGWWPSYPAEPIRGVMVSDQFHRVSRKFESVPGMVHPQDLAEPLAELRIEPEHLPADLMQFFVPDALEIDQGKSPGIHSVARIVCECANIHSTATWLLDHEPWDLCAVYFDAIDHFGHGFMKYNPPRRPHIEEEDFNLYHGVLRAGYLLHDRMLGTLLEKAGTDTTVILLSDHGFHPDHLRPARIPEYHAGPAFEHRNNGVFVMAGPGVRQGAALPGVSLLDIAPTVLSLFGLPVGRDMEGKVLAGAFESAPPIQHIPTWEKVEGDDGRHPPHMKLDPLAATESLEQLVALGYVEEPDADDDQAARRTVADLRTNLAEAYQDAGRHAEAAVILRELRDENPDDLRIHLRLFIAAQALGSRAEMEAIAADWSGRRKQIYESSLARLNELRARGRASKTMPRLNAEERAELKALRRLCRYDPSLTIYFEAQILGARRKWREALATLEAIPVSDLIRPGLLVDRAELLGRVHKWNEAATILHDALAIDSTDARIHFSLARLALHNRDFSAAAQHALDGIALLERDPRGHYLLGIALVRLGKYEPAVCTFERALAIHPAFPQAHLWLARVHRALGDRETAAFHARARVQTWQKMHVPSATITRQPAFATPAPRPTAIAGSARELPPLNGEVVIVCGLPRSGTSMLMQMLVAGGLPAVTDGIRSADEDNPRGYYEFEAVKQMADGAPWIEGARGKAVKIVAPLIPHLPDGVACRVLLTERDINDIIASQRQMMIRRGRSVSETPARLARLKNEYLRLIIWTKGFLASRPDTKLLCLDRNTIIRDPWRAAEAINRFLGGNLDVGRMAGEVKPELSRQNSVQAETR